MTWSKEFEAGLRDIDCQHRTIVGHVELLEAAQRRREPPEVLAQIAQELVRFMQYHFDTEESAMRVYGYEGAEHRSAHLGMVNAVRRRLGEPSLDLSGLRLFLYNWLTDHVTLEDAKLVAHIAACREPMAELAKRLEVSAEVLDAVRGSCVG